MNIVKELVAYVTISDNAYGKDNAEIVPYFGWKGSTEAGSVLLNGLTVRKVGDQWNDAEENFGFTTSGSTNGVLAKYVWKNNEINDSPIAYQTTVEAKNSTTQGDFVLTAPAFDQSDGATNWTLSFWAKTVDGLAGNGTTLQFGSVSKPIKTNGNWQFFTETVTGKTLDDALLRFTVSRKSTLYLNGMSLVPGKVALANESDQNSAAVKNITVNTGTKKFNTAVEYDTDEAFTSYSRVKHYIIDGEAYSYSYDTAGNIQKIQNPDGSWVSYEYDALNQLIAEHHSNVVSVASLFEGGGAANAATEGVSYNTISYSYDTRGNILSKVYSLNGETVDTITYTYGNTVWKDQLTSFDGVSIDYDEIGNPTNWVNGETLSWQHGRQLASYAKDGNTISYTYNSDGIRTSKTVGNVTTTYNVVDGVLRSLTQGNHTLRFFDNQILYNNTSYWFVTNAQNDVIGIIDQNGDYVVKYTYDSWGAPLSVDGSMATTLGKLNPFRYRGYIYDDETGFYYCQSRYYDPEVSRWLNADGYTTTGETSISHNMYAYCANSPINNVDYSGELFKNIWYTFKEWGRNLLAKFWGSSDTVGCAKPYVELPENSGGVTTNCYAYVNGTTEGMQVGGDSGIDASLVYQVDIIANIVRADYHARGQTARRISGPDAKILSDEYRIALRQQTQADQEMLKLDWIVFDTHFMVQTQSGQWAEKPGQEATILHEIGENPSTIKWDHGYDSDIIYLAIGGK